MAKTLDPFFSTAVRNVAAKATAAKTTMSDNANAALLFTAGAEGSICNRLLARGLANYTDTVCYVFTSSDSGTTLNLKAAVKASAPGTAISTTAVAPAIDMGASFDAPLQFSANERVYVAISVAQTTGFLFEGSVEDF